MALNGAFTPGTTVPNQHSPDGSGEKTRCRTGELDDRLRPLLIRLPRATAKSVAFLEQARGRCDTAVGVREQPSAFHRRQIVNLPARVALSLGPRLAEVFSGPGGYSATVHAGGPTEHGWRETAGSLRATFAYVCSPVNERPFLPCRSSISSWARFASLQAFRLRGLSLPLSAAKAPGREHEGEDYPD